MGSAMSTLAWPFAKTYRSIMGVWLSFISWVRPPMVPLHPLQEQARKIDTEKLQARYEAERTKRLRKDGVAQFKTVRSSAYNDFAKDVAHVTSRSPIEAETKVFIIGSGFAGIAAAVHLEMKGVHDFRIVDKGAGFGGTWYWNSYPGAACDVESLLYLPFLEETNYIPKDRFSYGPEIRQQIHRVVTKYDLERRAHMSTEVTELTWDEALKRWHVRTNHGDHFITQFVVMSTGTFHEPKLPGIPGIQDFKGRAFHTSRWDYDFTGGDETGNMTKLANKRVGIIGTGASAVQLVPRLAADAKQLYVFQRTPSTVRYRENYHIEPEKLPFLMKPDWQRERMRDFANILTGECLDKECEALEGLEEFTMKAIFGEAAKAGVKVKPEEIPELMQKADYVLMDTIRNDISKAVSNQSVAEKLMPWYSFMCKRPAFHNEYITTFNKPNVELIDTDGQGISRVTQNGVVANDKEYPIDLLIYSTGFDFELEVGFERRTGIKMVGSQGRTWDEKWAAKGPSTLFGIHNREFPNLFYVGPVQMGVTANWTHTTYVAGEHIAEVVSTMLQDGSYQAIEPTEEAEEEWGRKNEEGSEMRLKFAQTCPPGYYNREGKPEEISPRWAYFPKGITAWQKITKEWREEGGMKGMERR